MSHFQRGYAAVKFTYKFSVTRTEEKRMLIDEHAPFQDASELIESEIIEENWEKTIWAKCKKNQTGDEFLSDWIKEVATSAAQAIIEQEIQSRNEGNKRRIEAWQREENDKRPEAERRHRTRLRRVGEVEEDDDGPKAHLRPILVEYEAFEGKRLKMGAPYRMRDEPNSGKDFGRQVAWTD